MADLIRASDLAELLKDLAAEIRGFVEHALGPIKAQQAELARRIDAMQEPKQFQEKRDEEADDGG